MRVSLSLGELAQNVMLFQVWFLQISISAVALEPEQQRDSFKSPLHLVVPFLRHCGLANHRICRVRIRVEGKPKVNGQHSGAS